MDKDLLAIGDLNALNHAKSRSFKYVLGADVTVMTDMMVSAQFIQERNLDLLTNKIATLKSYAPRLCTCNHALN